MIECGAWYEGFCIGRLLSRCLICLSLMAERTSFTSYYFLFVNVHVIVNVNSNVNVSYVNYADFDADAVGSRGNCIAD